MALKYQIYEYMIKKKILEDKQTFEMKDLYKALPAFEKHSIRARVYENKDLFTSRKRGIWEPKYELHYAVLKNIGNYCSPSQNKSIEITTFDIFYSHFSPMEDFLDFCPFKYLPYFVTVWKEKYER